MCPVLQLLSLAIADGALEDVDGVDDLERIRYRSGCPVRQIFIREERSEMPIIRKLVSGGSRHVSDSEILSVGSLHNMLRALGERAGYQDPLKAYNFRRMHGNMLDSESIVVTRCARDKLAYEPAEHVSAARRSKHFGHRNERSFLSYISDISDVHTQAHFNGKSPDDRTIGLLQSMERNLDMDAQQPPGSQLTDVPVAIFTAEGQAQYPALEERLSAFRSAKKLQIDTSSLYEGDVDGSAQSRPSRSRYLECLLRYDQGRKAISELLYPKTTSEGNVSVSRSELMSYFVDMAGPCKSVPRYPDAVPADDGSCTWCLNSGTSYQKNIQPWNIHLLSCARQRKHSAKLAQVSAFRQRISHCRWGQCRTNFEARSDSEVCGHIGRHARLTCLWDDCWIDFEDKRGLRSHLIAEHEVFAAMPTSDSYCHECRLWITSDEDWESHCLGHLHEMDQFCGLIRWQGLIIRAQRCMFCLGDESIRASRRLLQFVQTSHLHKHLATHLARVLWPLLCPHPRCTSILEDTRAFWIHANGVHKVRFPFARAAALPEQEDEATKQSDTVYLDDQDLLDGDLDTWLGHLITPDFNSFDFGPASSVAEFTDSLASGVSWWDAKAYSEPIPFPDTNPVDYVTSETGIPLHSSALQDGAALRPSAVHTNELDKSNAKAESLFRPFTCPHERCDWTFATKSALASHSKTHKHRDCPEGCGAVFDMYKELKGHLLHVHGKKLRGGARV